MKRLTLAVLLAATPALAQSPCDGLIQDKLDHPMDANAVPKPAPGASYVDPVFGTKITRITHASDDPTSNCRVSNTLYQSNRSWNADDSLIALWKRCGATHYEIYQGDAPYQMLCDLDFSGTNTVPTDIEQLIWDPVDPNVLYYPSGYSQSSEPEKPRLMKVVLNDVNKGGGACDRTITLVRKFATECAAVGLQYKLRLGHAQDMAVNDPDKKIALMCGTTSSPGGTRHEMIYSITNDQVLAQRDTGETRPAWIMDSGSLVYDRESGEIMDTSYNVLRSVTDPQQEHYSKGWVPGFDFYTTVDFDGSHPGSAVAYNMNTGAQIPVIALELGWPYPKSDTHPSHGAKDGSGWIVVGGVGNGLGQTVLDNELALANVQTGEVCRVAHLRTQAGHQPGNLWNYWGESHPSISRDGYRALFQSDWNNSESVEVFVVDLRPSGLGILTPSFPNAVVGEPYNAPLSVFGGAGPPFTCSIIGTPPAGLSLPSCSGWSGSATQVETQSFTVHACDAASSCVDKAFSIETQERPQITSTSPLPDAVVGSPYSFTFSGTKGVLPYQWQALSVPPAECSGMALNGAIWEGSPNMLGSSCIFTIEITDSHPSNPLSSTALFTMPVILPAAGCPCGPSAPVMILETKP